MIISCTKNTCDEQLADALIQYNKSIGFAGSSIEAAKEIKKQYEEKVRKIKENCD